MRAGAGLLGLLERSDSLDYVELGAILTIRGNFFADHVGVDWRFAGRLLSLDHSFLLINDLL